MSQYEKKPNEGALFKNKEMREGKQDAHAKGDALIVCPHCEELTEFWLKAWTNLSKKGERWQKITLAPKGAKKTSKAPDQAKAADEEKFDDDIPF